jgi:predicted phage tail protein
MGAGGNGGVLNLVLGAVLIASAFLTGGASMTAWGALSTGLFGAGVGMFVGGIASMLTPKANAQDQNQDGNKSNFGFGGAVTTIAQGNPIPILYGQREVGGFIVNAGQFAVDTFSSADAGYTGGGGSGGKK